ncbi:MAG: prephenate dehydratase [Actinomycetota bacterium]
MTNKVAGDKIGYLGPPGTFAEEALLSILRVDEGTLVPYPTVPDIIQAVEKGKVPRGIIPIENSIEGSINVTLDIMAFESNVLIEREIIIPVRHNLIARRGMKITDIKGIVSQPHATAQCRLYLAKNLPDIPIIAANSTAEAVKRIAESDKSYAAIGTTLAAKLYGLSVLAKDIEDYKDNQTRFVIVGKEKTPRTGHDKTSIICMIHEDRPGSLLQILQEFAYRYINLTKIESRPAKKALGEYMFFIDMEGHIDDPIVAEAINCLKCKIKDVKFLGSYPRG